MNSKQELITVIIPRIKEMMRKEKEHLKFLIDSKTKKSYSKINIDEMIDKTKILLNHLKTRLKKYEEYSEKL